MQIIAAARDVQEKTEIYTPYNILPLDAAGASVPIMQFEEVLLFNQLMWGSLCFIWHCIALSSLAFFVIRLRLLFLRFGILVA